MTEAERMDLMDRLPRDMPVWEDEEELDQRADRTLGKWRADLGHATSHPGCCSACGCGITCTLGHFIDSLIERKVR